MLEKIPCQNRKYRIKIVESDSGHVLVKRLYLEPEDIVISSKQFAYLEKRVRFFGWSWWKIIGITNIS